LLEAVAHFQGLTLPSNLQQPGSNFDSIAASVKFYQQKIKEMVPKCEQFTLADLTEHNIEGLLRHLVSLFQILVSDKKLNQIQDWHLDEDERNRIK
jgi:hypothetical protein